MIIRLSLSSSFNSVLFLFSFWHLCSHEWRKANEKLSSDYYYFETRMTMMIIIWSKWQFFVIALPVAYFAVFWYWYWWNGKFVSGVYRKSFQESVFVKWMRWLAVLNSSMCAIKLAFIGSSAMMKRYCGECRLPTHTHTHKKKKLMTLSIHIWIVNKCYYVFHIDQTHHVFTIR